jgi:hypothetical protein
MSFEALRSQVTKREMAKNNSDTIMNSALRTLYADSDRNRCGFQGCWNSMRSSQLRCRARALPRTLQDIE